MDEVTKAHNGESYVVSLFKDLSKAFDTVNQPFYFIIKTRSIRDNENHCESSLLPICNVF